MTTDPADWRQRASANRLALAVAGVTLIALAARLVGLGARVAHWDEGRVGYWILRYMETGAHEYRPIVHGPFLPLVNDHVFSLLGASDATGRLVVALVGGVMPLAALLFRRHLRDDEVLAMAFFLAANPVLLYYSRFMRNDVLVAGFMLFALGSFVRAYDTGLPRYLYAGSALVALGFTAKENAPVYLLCWGGALVLLLDHRLFRARPRGRSPFSVATDYARWTRRSLSRWRGHALLATVEFLLVIFVFYAPRAGDAGGLGLWAAFAQPSMVPELVVETYVGSTSDLLGRWASDHGNSYLSFLGHYLQSMAYGAAALSALAVGGFLLDRYAADGPRDLVAFASYWGVVSVFGYPIAMDIQAAWGTVHAIVPLAIPAAVGLAAVVRWTRDAATTGDGMDVAVGVVLVLLVTGAVVVPAVDATYRTPTSQDNELVQYAQPADDVRPAIERAAPTFAENEGPDVLFYGPELYLDNESVADRAPVEDSRQNVGTGGWFKRLPIPWYLEMHDAEVTSVETPTEFERAVGDDPPPVVIAHEHHRNAVDQQLGPEYSVEVYEMRLWSDDTLVYVDESRLD